MKAGRLVVAVVAVAVLAGCNVLQGKKIDYKSAGKLPPLEVPPDLTAPAADDRYAVPDISPQGSATFSAYSKERGAQPQPGASGLLPQQGKVTVERAGAQRWLAVRATPEEVWPVVKEFWQEMGFLIKTEAPEAGLMETDWAENRAKIPMDPIRNVLSKVVDGLYSTSERDKFRTRLERGAETGVTEIYISHRGMIEVFENASSGRTVWQPRPSDPELEAEMLRRLMTRFGVEEARAQSLMAASAVAERAKINRAPDGASSLTVNDPFDRAWRRVGLVLDRIGFTVIDRDRSQGLYFVRYVDPEADAAKKEEGWLSKLWKGDGGKSAPQEQYRILVKEADGATTVQVQNKEGRIETSETGTRILNLLYEQLK
ncbi:MAG: outer membrane protein assembly factor BamC [Pseudomonadota bacterium]